MRDKDPPLYKNIPDDILKKIAHLAGNQAHTKEEAEKVARAAMERCSDLPDSRQVQILSEEGSDLPRNKKPRLE